MNHGKRIFALMLAVILTVSVFPVSAFAGNLGKDLGYYKGEKEYSLDVIPATAVSDEGVLVVAGSDFQDPATNNTSSSNTGAYAAQVSRISNIMTEIKAHYSSDNIVSYGFFAGGDYMYESNGKKDKTNLGISQVKGAVASVLGSDTDMVIVQGNHDYTGANYDAGGAHDTDYYGVYSINEDDYESKVSSDAKTKASAKALDAYLSAKKEAGYTKPVFVITHVPLHYSTRTKAEKDAMYAYYLYEVLEKYGDDLNIIFLYGHDHAWGDDDYLGGSSVYLEKGSDINIAGTRSGNTITPSQNSYVTLPINFTYMNYGYTGYYYSSWNTHEPGLADSTLTMTSFYISGGDVEIIRWSENADANNGGMHVLKAAGHATKGMRGVSEVCPVTNNIVNSPFVLGLKGYVLPVTPEEPPVTPGEPDPDDPDPEDVALEDEDSGVGIATTAGSAVAVEEGDNSQTYAIIEKYVSYNITVADFVNGTDHATVSIPVPAGYDSSRIRVYFRDADGSLTDMNARVENGNVVFSTDHFSEYLLAEGSSADIDGWVAVPGSGNYTYTLDTDGIDSGAQYIIVGASGSNYVFTGANKGTGTSTGTSVSVNNDTVSLSTNDYAWIIAQSGSNYNISQGSDYMYFDGSSSNPAEIKTRSTAYGWTVSGSDGSYRIGEPGTNRTLRYNSGFGIGNNNGNRVRLFKQTSAPAAAYYLGMDIPEDISVPLGQYTAQKLIAYLKTVIGVYRADDTNGSNIAAVTDYSLTASGNLPTDSVGTVTYTVIYNGVTVGSFDVNFVQKTAPQILEDDYPSYPNPGSVRVGKTGSGIDWTSTGIAEIELAATGVPYKTQGVDIIIMLDTSSSMNSNSITYEENGRSVTRTRMQVMQDSLKSLIANLKNNADGSSSEVRVAIADFNGYTNINSNDKLSSSVQTADFNGHVTRPNAAGTAASFTAINIDAANGLSLLDADAFVAPEMISDAMIDNMSYYSGTNYDYAFDAIYRLGSAIKAKNKTDGTDRNLYVIFMTDGAAFQYNYFMTSSGFNNRIDNSSNTYTDWNSWLKGSFNQNNSYFNSSSHKYFFNPVTAEDGALINQHWMAAAIKGDEDKTYKVISPDASLPNSSSVNGESYMYNVPGLGATMYSIGYCLYDDKAAGERNTAATGALYDEMLHNISHLASYENGEYLYFDADKPTDLNDAFDQIVGSVKQAATNAYFVDTMGSEYDLQLATFDYTVPKYDGAGNPNGTENKTIAPTIEVREYDIYKASEFGENDKNNPLIGTRKNTFRTLETVSFNADGSEAYTGGNTFDNILVDGVICANTFWYNTSKTAAAQIDTDGDEAPDYSLAPETFYWKVGTIGESELALHYYVYLTGSMQGTRLDGFYPTNTNATLYYTNWLDHDYLNGDPQQERIHKDTVSPILPWGIAKINYAFYLVDANGKVITDKTTFATGTFANKVAITQPVVGATINLNSSGTVSAAEVSARTLEQQGALPTGYQLYDPDASYTVAITSNGIGSYFYGVNNVTPLTTYATDYHGADYVSVGGGESHKVQDVSYNYLNTTVWFAVKFELKAIPDTVVIDFGLPVDISVLANDLFGSYGALDSIGMTNPNPADGYTPELVSGFDKTLAQGSDALRYGSAAVNGTKVRYTPENMQMDDVESFAYAVHYTKDDVFASPDVYFYSDVTVVPATVIYYEDSFVHFEGSWTTEGTTLTGTQSEDRPGFGNLSEVDGNNIYGYDAVYANCGTFSYGSAKKVTVSAGQSPWPTATFTFTGTGFDIISLTSKDTGYVNIKVYAGSEARGNYLKNWSVDTFYGYSEVLKGYAKYDWIYGTDNAWHVSKIIISESEYNAVPEADRKQTAPGTPQTGDEFTSYEPYYEWTVTESTENSLYQIPVLKSYDTLPYGTYTVVVSPMYSGFYDHVRNDSSYDFYFDAVRIYGPAKSASEANDIYFQDNEGCPQFLEIREKLIGQAQFAVETTETITGAAFIDGFETIANNQISEYANFGPNNEVYLAPNQSVAFALTTSNAANIAAVHASAKTVNGAGALRFRTVKPVYNQNHEITGYKYGNKELLLNTATDLYYDITDLISWEDSGMGNTVIITNTGDHIVSLTNIKITYNAGLGSTTGPLQAIIENSTDMVVSGEIVSMANYALLSAYVGESAAPEDPAPSVFKPGIFTVKLSSTNVRAGDRFTVTVTTSGDVASIAVNDQSAMLTKTDKKTGKKTWTIQLRAVEAGSYLVSTVAYDADRLASEAIENTVTVRSSGKIKTIFSSASEITSEKLRP